MKKKVIVSLLLGASLLSNPLMAKDTQQGISTSKVKYKLPSPFSMYSAYNKISPNTKWSKLVSKNYSISYESDPQIAYNLGLQISKSYLLFNDKKISSKNISMIDILATKLGINQTIVKRISTIKNALLAKQTQDALQEIEYMKDDIKQELKSQKRVDLAIVTTVGSWIGAMDAVANAVDQNYNKDAAGFLAQKRLIKALYSRLETIESLTFDPVTQEIISSLKNMETLIGNSKELNEDKIKKMRFITNKIVYTIEKA